jgi:PAS domain S-box-containing protein
LIDQQAILARHSIPAILQGIADGVTIQDADGRLVYSNDAAARLCGFADSAAIMAASAEQVLAGVELLDAHGRPLEPAVLPARLALRGEEPAELLVRHRHRASGEERWAIVKARAIAGADGAPALAVTILRDVTERVLHEREARQKAEQLAELNARLARANAELRERTAELELANQDSQRARAAAEEADRAKSQFLAVMSHELRTPLNGVLGYADLLSLGIGGALNEAQLEHVDRIRQSGRQLLDLIDDVLGMARIESGREVVQITEEDARSIARQAASIVESQAAIKELTLLLEMPDAPLPIVTDAGKLRQVLLNLLSNAVKFTHAGSVVLRVSRNGESACFDVVDTGIGIEADQLERIFEPFTQVDQSNTRSRGGVGLGLTVSRRLAELLGGTLECMSEPGRGTRFTLTLPREPRHMA